MIEELQGDYKAFHAHFSVYEANGIPVGLKDLVRVAKIYGCEVPKIVDGKVVFKTI